MCKLYQITRYACGCIATFDIYGQKCAEEEAQEAFRGPWSFALRKCKKIVPFYQLRYNCPLHKTS